MKSGWFAAAVLLFTWSLTTHGKYSVSGDEPHYLMISHSLLYDGDLDLANNYTNDDGRFFGHSNLEQGLHAVRAKDGRVQSIHDIGLAIFVAPVYATARLVADATSEPLLRRFRMSRGLFSYSIVSLFLIALTTVGMTLVAIALQCQIGDPRAMWLTLLAAISPPVLSHAFLVFPEVLGLFLTSVVVWWCLKKPSSQDRALLLAVALAIGLLPWAHHKFLVYTPGLVFVMVWNRWDWLRTQSSRSLALGLALYLLPQFALHAWTWHTWGTLGGALTTQELPFSVATLQSGALGLWIDEQSGLLAYAPMYWLLPVSVALTWRKSWPFIIPFALLYLPAAAFVIGWWAGFAPAARYLVPAIPLLLVPLAQSLKVRWIRWILVGLSVPQLVINLLVWQRPRLLWPSADGNPALQALGPLGRLYEGVLPALQHGAPSTVVLLGAVSLVVTCVVLARNWDRRRPTV